MHSKLLRQTYKNKKNMNNNPTDPNVTYSTIRVYSNTQNRMALGILHAYLKMFPQTTLKDLCKAFPEKLNPDSGMKQLFIPIEKMVDEPKWQDYFREDEELLCMSDGSKVAVASRWSSASLERLSDHAKQFGIELANFEFGEKYDKCGFRLECVAEGKKVEPQEKKQEEAKAQIQTPVPPIPPKEQTSSDKDKSSNNKKKETKMEKSNEKDDETKTHIPWWMWLLLLLMAGAAVGAFFLGRHTKEAEIQVQEVEVEVPYEVEVEKEVLIHDTVTVTVFKEKIEEIEKNFNAAKFKSGKADLNDDAKFVLHDLVKILEKQPDVRLKIVGHTSEEGSPSFNQKLSEKRAKAVVDFLVARGINPDRLEYEGKGSSEPLEAGNNEVNRRTQIIVLQ